MKPIALAFLALAALGPAAVLADNPARKTLQVVRMANPEFPPELTRRGIVDGDASAVVSLGADGRPVDWIIVAYSDPAFEPLAQEILRSLECKPLGGDAPVRANIRLIFETRGVVVSHAASETVDRLITPFAGSRRIDKLTTPPKLDRPLAVRRTVPPEYPAALHAGGSDRVILEFLVDENGRVRMPVLHAGDNLLLANTAASALAEWEFEPPHRDGRPAIAVARQEFVLPPP